MKKIVCLFFVFQLFYAQNAEERKKIVASYDQVKLNQLNQYRIKELDKKQTGI